MQFQSAQTLPDAALGPHDSPSPEVGDDRPGGDGRCSTMPTFGSEGMGYDYELRIRGRLNHHLVNEFLEMELVANVEPVEAATT